jgi:5-formyltetrahydrofolate cyclo-ligase
MTTALSHRSQLRKQLRQARNGLTQADQQIASQLIVDQLENYLRPYAQLRIAAYLANDGEIDLHLAFKAFWQAQKTTYLPVIHPFSRQHLLFLQYNAQTSMVKNRFGIAEPQLACPQVCPVHTLDFILMPLVGFDSQGNRLGMGGGFYDRTLAHMEQWSSRPKLIGIAHACQQVDVLPVENWDVPLDAIITPEQIINA